MQPSSPLVFMPTPQNPSLHFPTSPALPRIAVTSPDLLCCCSFSPRQPCSDIHITTASLGPPVTLTNISCSACVILQGSLGYVAVLQLPASIRIVFLSSSSEDTPPPQPPPAPPPHGCVVWSPGDSADVTPFHMYVPSYCASSNHFWHFSAMVPSSRLIISSAFALAPRCMPRCLALPPLSPRRVHSTISSPASHTSALLPPQVAVALSTSNLSPHTPLPSHLTPPTSFTPSFPPHPDPLFCVQLIEPSSPDMF
jgi:hypothetical protein